MLVVIPRLFITSSPRALSEKTASGTQKAGVIPTQDKRTLLQDVPGTQRVAKTGSFMGMREGKEEGVGVGEGLEVTLRK